MFSKHRQHTPRQNQPHGDSIDGPTRTLSRNHFKQDGNLYQEEHGAAMGSPLSPTIANIYMEFFEELALESTHTRPSLWLRYVDDTTII